MCRDCGRIWRYGLMAWNLGRGGGFEERLQFGGEWGGKAAGFVGEVGAGVFRGGFEEEFVRGGKDAVRDGEACAAKVGEPDFDGEKVVVAGGMAIAEPAFDDREQVAGLL